MKIISGRFKGRKLLPVSKFTIRPTSSRVKEAIFSILSYKVENACVLDLFAGTGALGIEAMSRGAERVVFVDRNRKIVSNINCNLRNLNIEKKGYVLKKDIAKGLNCLKFIKNNFDIVFVDPPYSDNILGLTLRNLIEATVLNPRVSIVVEHHITRKIDLERLSGMFLSDQRKYGDTIVSFLFLR